MRNQINAQGAILGDFFYRSRGWVGRFVELFSAEDVKQLDFVARIKDRTGETIHQSRVSNFINGKATPSFEEMELLAAGLGVDPRDLLFGAEEKAQKGKRPPNVHHLRITKPPTTKQARGGGN